MTSDIPTLVRLLRETVAAAQGPTKHMVSNCRQCDARSLLQSVGYTNDDTALAGASMAEALYARACWGHPEVHDSAEPECLRCPALDAFARAHAALGEEP